MARLQVVSPLNELACISHQFGVTAEGRGFNPAEKRHFDSIPSHALGSSSRRTAERVKVQEGRRRLITAGLKPRPSGRAGEKSGLGVSGRSLRVNTRLFEGNPRL